LLFIIINIIIHHHHHHHHHHRHYLPLVSPPSPLDEGNVVCRYNQSPQEAWMMMMMVMMVMMMMTNGGWFRRRGGKGHKQGQMTGCLVVVNIVAPEGGGRGSDGTL